MYGWQKIATCKGRAAFVRKSNILTVQFGRNYFLWFGKKIFDIYDELRIYLNRTLPEHRNNTHCTCVKEMWWPWYNVKKDTRMKLSENDNLLLKSVEKNLFTDPITSTAGNYWLFVIIRIMRYQALSLYQEVIVIYSWENGTEEPVYQRFLPRLHPHKSKLIHGTASLHTPRQADILVQKHRDF